MLIKLEDIDMVMPQKSIPKIKTCMFCYVEKNLIIKETENFYLIKDKYPIIKNHLMIISKNHIGCLGEVPDSQLSEFNKMIDYALCFLNLPDFITFYEHGRAGHCVKLKNSEITCHHFHFHILNQKTDVASTLIKNFDANPIFNISEVKKLYERKGNYLLYGSCLEDLKFYPSQSGFVPSHYLRTLICHSLNLENRSDWEKLEGI